MLLVFGAITMDLVFPVPRLPRAGDTLWCGASRMQPGGKGANQAVAARRDGAAVTLAGAVGCDAMGEAALAALSREGVELRLTRHADAETGRSAIAVDPEGYTAVMTDAGANLRAAAAHMPDAIMSGRATLLLQMENNPDETAALIRRARHCGARIVLNVSPARPLAADALRAADVLIGSSQEIAWLGEHLGTGNNPASVHEALGVSCVRMMGPRGAEAFGPEGWRQMPALPVDVRDTTGAGDCFVGIFAASLARGLAFDDALRRAAVAAALSVRVLGAQDGFPDASAIDGAMSHAPCPTAREAVVPD